LASNEVKILGHRRKVALVPMKSGPDLIFASRNSTFVGYGNTYSNQLSLFYQRYFIRNKIGYKISFILIFNIDFFYLLVEKFNLLREQINFAALPIV